MSRISKKTLKQFNNLSFLCEEVLAEKLLDFVSSVLAVNFVVKVYYIATFSSSGEEL